MAAVYWIGQDGNIYYGSGEQGAEVQNLGKADGSNGGQFIAKPDGLYDKYTDNGVPALTFAASQIADPKSAGSTTTSNFGSGTTKTQSEINAELKAAQDAADRTRFKGEIAGKTQSVEDVYASLFGDTNSLVTARDAELETQYGDQFKKAGDQYADAIPQIETSYASLGAADSTDNTYAKVGAKKGFEDTTKTIGDNKKTDKAALGKYKIDNDAKTTQDRDAARQFITNAASTNDVDALRSGSASLTSNIAGATATRASLATDDAGRKTVSDLTKDGGRFDSTINALDGILKSSLSGSVKNAAVKAVTENSGLSDEEKAKVQATYGNVYAEQSAL